MRGYKAFDENMTCSGMAYEVGGTYAHDGELALCKSGLHFCDTVAQVFEFYPAGSRVCEVEAFGNVLDSASGDGKHCTDLLRVVRELTAAEVSALANAGSSNTGVRNSGDRNSGNWNSGDWNMTNFSSGVLCTEEPECLIFDKPSGMTLREWRKTAAALLLTRVNVATPAWREWDELTDAERVVHARLECQGGVLVVPDDCGKQRFQEWWDGLANAERETIMAMSNFDAAKWKAITGIEVVA